MKREVYTGIIKLIQLNKDYGFIDQDENEEDIFFHSASVLNDNFKDLREGQKVKYYIIRAPRGTKAIGVRLIKEEGE